ncbi:MAG: flagellar filament capping protein FliD, partial [Gammaproteobacteria bacterium]|nr:flagellar filament capping protein FliD [Gammaproteobacteria bacterium]
MDSNNIISSLGGGSGINTSSLVEGLIAAERIPKESQYDAKQEKLDLQLSSYGVMASAMSTLNESAAALGSSETFNTKNVSYTETTVLTPTAVDADALAGEYEVEVTALAKSHSLSSASYSDTGGQVGKGVLTFKFGAWDAGYTAFTLDGDKATQAITIDDSNNSLTGLRDAINDADFGVQASIVQEGSGYKLQVIGPSGASNELEITVVEDGSAGGEAGDVDATGLSLLAFNTAGSQLTANQAGADAALNVNGMAVTRESNKIDDVIQGLDFTLNKASVGEIVAFTITDDTVAAEQAVRDFVTAYNDFF